MGFYTVDFPHATEIIFTFSEINSHTKHLENYFNSIESTVKDEVVIDDKDTNNVDAEIVVQNLK